jgi:carboxyl-terminal processing protease
MNAGGFAIVKRMQKAPKWLRTAGLVLAAFAGGAVTSHLANASTQSSSPYAPFEQLSRVLVLVENSYVEPAQRNKIIEGAIKGMVAELDPHSVYMNPTEYAIFQGDTEGKFGGIGVEVDYRSEFVTILAPIEGSPAERAGIKAGDQILAINGKSVRGEPIDKLVGLMRGPAGSKVRILLRRPGVADPIQMELMREEIHVQSVVSKRLADDVAYIRLRQFQEGTHEELLRAAGSVRAEGKSPLKGVLLDMRNNPGGLVDEAEAVADEFLASGAIYSTRHRGKIIDEVKAQSGGAFTAIPVVVLVNEYSASSAELVAGALQDSRGATVVGANTFGKGSVQTIFELPGGAGLRLTTMRYYTPSGRSIQAEGIKPDFEISALPPAEGSAPSLGIVRERDLEGHLPADNAPGTPERKVTVVTGGNTAAGGNTPVVVSPKDIPFNPVKGQDFALSVAYQLLLKGAGVKR